ncbi:MAG: hypothetical protein H7A55_14640 [Verrucomicrobiaceae bacterium]|nr:hypothetical protein [Verrucomicrobiaceae bacterium]
MKLLHMKASPSFNRRQFIHRSIAAGTCLSAGLSRDLVAASLEGETEHFWYRMPSADEPYIDTQRDNKAFAFQGTQIMLSEDNGMTWPHQAEFPEAQNITFSVILKSGNVLFATRNRLFLSTDNLKTHREIIVKRPDGSNYLPHHPVDPKAPGWYFHSLDGEHCFDVNGKEMLVWGNYCNVLGGSVPVNVYYSTDSGETVKLAYAFGQNPTFQQKGAVPDAPMLGDPDNKLIARHVHNVAYNPTENAFYVCTGDIDRDYGNEVHWLRGTYDSTTDEWDWKPLISVNSNSRFKCGGFNFIDGKMYWIADANGLAIADRYDRGIFMADPAEVIDKSKHTLLFNPGYESANMLYQEGVFVATHCAPASPYGCGIIWSPDKGRTWAQYDLKEFGPRSGCRINKKNSDGWFRMDLRKGWIERAEVLFLKPKP